MVRADRTRYRQSLEESAHHNLVVDLNHLITGQDFHKDIIRELREKERTPDNSNHINGVNGKMSYQKYHIYILP